MFKLKSIGDFSIILSTEKKELNKNDSIYQIDLGNNMNESLLIRSK